MSKVISRGTASKETAVKASAAVKDTTSQAKELAKLHKVVNDFINSAAGAPAQKSREWYAIKAKTIGGSEVATVLGMNPYSTVKKLIADKVGIKEFAFNGNTACRWGNMFESVTRDFTQTVLSLDECIQETGSIPGVVDRQRYSPDGVGVVKLLDADDKPAYYIVLFEFKSPARSIPDGKIPKHYLPQVKTGLLSIDICDTAIFVNNCYRKCALKNIGFDLTYDTIYHDGDAKKKKKSQVIDTVYATGIICLYQTAEDYEKTVKDCGYGSESDSDVDVDEFDLGTSSAYSKTATYNGSAGSKSYTSHYDMEILLNSNNSMIDFGTAKSKMMDRMFELYEEKRIKVMYYPMIINQEAVNELPFIEMHKKIKPVEKINVKPLIKTQLTSFLDYCEQNEFMPIGYLPWKLVKSDIIGEDRDEEWLSVIEKPITETLAIIDKIMASDDPAEEYYNIYPSHDAHVSDEELNGYADFMADLSDDSVVDMTAD